MSRDEILMSSRPELNLNQGIECVGMMEFTNSTLRPILKLQNDCLIGYFNGFLKSIKQDLKPYTFTARVELIRKIYRENDGLKRNLIMMVVAMFTQAEMRFYFENKSEVNKRTSELILKRITDQVELVG